MYMVTDSVVLTEPRRNHSGIDQGQLAPALHSRCPEQSHCLPRDTTQTWSGATAKIAESWYEDPETLYSIIKDGQVFNLDLSETPNTDEIAVVLEKSLFAASLPLVSSPCAQTRIWRLGSALLGLVLEHRWHKAVDSVSRLKSGLSQHAS